MPKNAPKGKSYYNSSPPKNPGKVRPGAFSVSPGSGFTESHTGKNDKPLSTGSGGGSMGRKSKRY